MPRLETKSAHRPESGDSPSHSKLIVEGSEDPRDSSSTGELLAHHRFVLWTIGCQPAKFHLRMIVRVALIEDDPRYRAMLVELLSREPIYQVVAELESLSSLHRHSAPLPWDVTLVDIHLPDGTGIEALRWIRGRPSPPRCVVLTVAADSATLFSALKAGADGYLLKTPNPGELLGQLAELLSGGAPMSPSIARRVLQHFRDKREVEASLTVELTPSERDVLQSLASGFTNKEIAARRNVSLSTIRSQVSAVYSKLEVRNRAEATSKYHGVG